MVFQVTNAKDFYKPEAPAAADFGGRPRPRPAPTTIQTNTDKNFFQAKYTEQTNLWPWGILVARWSWLDLLSFWVDQQISWQGNLK